MGNFEDDFFQCRDKVIIIEYEGPTQEEYTAVAKQQAENFERELTDLYTRYCYSTVGDMEKSGMLSAGEQMAGAIAILRTFKQAL